MTDLLPFDPEGEDYLKHLDDIGREDAAGLKKAQASYGNSWKCRGGVGAFMMMARKWDRMENRVRVSTTGSEEGAPGAGAWDIFAHVEADQRSEGVIDDIRDLRRYLMLVEADLRARGFRAGHRDNQPDKVETPEPVGKVGDCVMFDLEGSPLRLGDAVYIREAGTKVPGWEYDPVGKRLTVVGYLDKMTHRMVKVRLTFAPRPGAKHVTEEWLVNGEDLARYRDTRRTNHPSPFGYQGDN